MYVDVVKEAPSKGESGWLSGYQPCLTPRQPGFNPWPYGCMSAEFQSISI